MKEQVSASVAGMIPAADIETPDDALMPEAQPQPPNPQAHSHRSGKAGTASESKGSSPSPIFLRRTNGQGDGALFCMDGGGQKEISPAEKTILQTIK